jgi:hypothetical protein
MIGILATILLASNDKPENGGWIQLVVFVILGLMYALGGLAKMKADRTAEKEKEKDKSRDGLKHQPRYKPLKPRYKPFEPLTPPRQIRPKRPITPQASRITPRPTRPVRRPPEMPVPQKRMPVARVPEVTQKPVTFVVKPAKPTIKPPVPGVVPSEIGKIEKLGGGLSEKQKKADESISAGRLIFDYEDRDALLNAILHYEILGKPLSLRPPTQHAWEL